MDGEVTAVPDADAIWSAAPIVVRIADKEYLVVPPTVRQVRAFRVKLNALQQDCEKAMTALRRAPEQTPELMEAVGRANDAVLDAVLQTVPSIAADYDAILEKSDPNIGDQLEAAFHVVHDFYLNPLARRLAAKARATLQDRTNASPLKTVSSSISSCADTASRGMSSSESGPMPSSDT